MGSHDVEQERPRDDADREAEEKEEELARGHGARWTRWRDGRTIGTRA